VNALDPGVAVYAAARMDDVVGHSIARPRLELRLFALFGALALLLASIGVYGLLSFSVGQRQQEIGVRMALGAQPRSVMTLVLRNGMRLVVAGILVGAVVSLASARVLGALLFELSPTDPPTFALVAALLAVIGVMACWIPARRAARVDPAISLKTE
ncbi:MAG: FtsX-like permease family protein, partial [Gemmatimonadales bacterium]